MNIAVKSNKSKIAQGKATLRFIASLGNKNLDAISLGTFRCMVDNLPLMDKQRIGKFVHRYI